MFFVEDATTLGNVYLTYNYKNPTAPIILLACDFFLDLFEEYTELDFVMLGSWYYDDYHLWYIERDMISQYRQHTIDTSRIELIDFKTEYIGFKYVIPLDKISENSSDTKATEGTTQNDR